MAKKYQREIEEILHQDDIRSLPKKRSWFRRVFVDRNSTKVGRQPLRIIGSQVMVGSISLLLVALLLNSLGLGFGMVLAWVGLLLFLISYLLFFTRTSTSIEKRWRGQALDDSLESKSPLRHIFRWFRR